MQMPVQSYLSCIHSHRETNMTNIQKLKYFFTTSCKLSTKEAEELSKQIYHNNNITYGTAKLIGLSALKHKVVLGGTSAAELLNMLQTDTRGDFNLVYAEYTESLYDIMHCEQLNDISFVFEDHITEEKDSIGSHVINTQFNGIDIKVTEPIRIIEDMVEKFYLVYHTVINFKDYKNNLDDAHLTTFEKQYLICTGHILAWLYAYGNQSFTKLLLTVNPECVNKIIQLKDIGIAFYNKNKTNYNNRDLFNYVD